MVFLGIKNFLKKEKRFAGKQAGFTLVETLLYVSILSMLMFVLSSFLIFILQSNQKSQTIARTEGDGQRAIQIILQTIRNAESVTVPSIGTTGSSLELVVSDAVKSPTIFSLSAGKILIKEGSGTAVELISSRNVASGLNFINTGTAGGPGSVKIQFNLAHNNTSGRNEFDWNQNFFGSAALR